MPRRQDLKSICLIGSGPIVIGQACEFDYAGCQALKVLREDGFRTIVVNSNPATIMTDPGFADATYLEPLDLEGVADVLGRERPDALLPTLGGQTALNLAIELADAGILKDLGVELLGAPVDVIRRAEDRELFREAVQSCGLTVPSSRIVTSVDDLAGVAVPAVVRPAFTLGGHGGGFVSTSAELRAQVELGLRESPIGQVLVEESVKGWDEFELEVIRDRRDNVVIVCSIENLDPMGVHTGDSVTVAPQLTLSDEAYQELRDAAIAVIRAVGVETGGSNIQFARDRETGEIRVIEMNPRVSRSSALASKATGYPIAKVAAKLAVGYTLDEIPNDLTKTTPASFEPTLDYVVVKFPRFAFEKFPGADTTLGTQMKSVGEAMGIGRTFQEAFWKAWSSRELDAGAVTPWAALDDLPDDLHPWFRRELEQLRVDGPPQGERVYRRVDSCAGEVAADSNYYYSTRNEADEPVPLDGQAARGHPRLRPEPDRPGDRVRLLLRPRRAELPGARLRGDHGQLQPGDGVDGLRHFRPALLRAARRRARARGLRARAARRGRDPVRRPDAAEAGTCDRGGRLQGARDTVRGGRSRRGPGALRAAARGARRPLPGVGDRRRARPGRRNRRPGRLSGARPALLRARWQSDAGLLRRGAGARCDGGRNRLRPRRPLPRRRARDRRRRALRRRLRPHRRRDGARRGGRNPLGRLVVRAAGALARRGGIRRPDRLRADRDRAGVRVRLRGLPGAEGAARGRLPHDRRQLEPGDDHDRPRLRRRDLSRAARPRGRRRRARPRAARRAAADARRPDRAQPRDRARRRGHPRGPRRRAARRAGGRDPPRRGPRALPRGGAELRAHRAELAHRHERRRPRRRRGARRSCARLSRSAATVAASSPPPPSFAPRSSSGCARARSARCSSRSR